jgi:peptidoglycan/LPS O-acetylase OafA/YrhL
LTRTPRIATLTPMDLASASLHTPPADPTSSSPDASVTPPRRQRDAALDGLRGLAVLLVFTYHYGGGLKSTDSFVHLAGLLTEACWIGIVLFFALSGFLITGSLWESIGQKDRLRNFYGRRALRILPLYYAAILAATVYSLARGSTFAELKPILLYVFFLQDLPHLATIAGQFTSALPLYHLWTLAVEEQFYLLWPVVLLFAHSRRHAVRLSLWFFGLTELFLVIVYTTAAFKGARAYQTYDKFLFCHTAALALGAAVCLAMGNRSAPTGRKPGSHRIVRKWATPAFYTGIALFLYSSHHGKSFYLTAPLQFWLGLPAISIAAAASIPIVLRTGIPRKIFSFAPLGFIGRIGYGFYVFHILLEPLYDSLATRLLHTTSGEDYQLARILIAFPITLAVSWLSFHFFESPILSLKRYLPMRQELPLGEPLDPELHSHRRRRSRSSTRK